MCKHVAADNVTSCSFSSWCTDQLSLLSFFCSSVSWLSQLHTHLFIHKPFFQFSIYLLTRLSFCDLSIHPSIYLDNHPSIYISIHPPIHPTMYLLHQPATYSFIYLYIHPSDYLATQPFVHRPTYLYPTSYPSIHS